MIANRRYRIALFVTLLMAALWLLIWLGASWAAPKVLREGLTRATLQAEARGLTLQDFQFEEVRVSPLLNRISIGEVAGKFDLEPTDDIQLQSQLQLSSMAVGIDSLWPLRGVVSARGVEARFDPSDLPPSLPYGYFFDGEVDIRDLPLADPRATLDKIRQGLKELFYQGSVGGDALFTGKVRIKVDDAETVATLYTKQVNNRFRLHFDKASIQSLAEQLQLDLVPEQITIVATYPLRAPRIMAITERARTIAARESGGDFWLEDAMRHVSWSFMLTETFGPEFAQVVTDAQEIGPGNSPDERAMDFHNNAIGRIFSAQGLEMQTLVQRVQTDSEVIRHPDEVGAFPGELLK